MRENYTHITFVLDRSGSMESCKTDTIGGTNRFLADQKKVPGDCSLLLVKFDHAYDVHHEGKLKECPNFTDENYTPRGSTALLDAIGRAIHQTGELLSGLPERDRPSKVIFVIMTDGYENSSTKYDNKMIAAMIDSQRDVYKWDFVFLAANQDAIATASKINISAAAAMSYNTQNTNETYDVVSQNLRSARVRGSAVSFNSEDRKKAMGEDSE